MVISLGLVAGFEGVRTTPYYDVAGVLTVCYGDTENVHTTTLVDCKARLNKRLSEFSDKIDACLHRDVPVKTYASYISLAYNIGARAFCHSTVLKRANAGDLIGSCKAILMWDKAGGRVVQGLINRRHKEEQVCLEGVNAT